MRQNPNPTPPSAPRATGHFPNEVLPRLLYLFRHTPPRCRMLVAADAFTERYLKLLPPEWRARIERTAAAKGHVYKACGTWVRQRQRAEASAGTPWLGALGFA